VDGHRIPTSLADIRSGLLPMVKDQKRRQGAEAGDDDRCVAVVEHLRLRVPAGSQGAWLQAELETWDPWLRQRKGFVEREMLWDSARQEGVLLIHWASADDWKAIPAAELAAIQERFEATAQRLLALPPHSDNPFPLVFAGEACPR